MVKMVRSMLENEKILDDIINKINRMARKANDKKQKELDQTDEVYQVIGEIADIEERRSALIRLANAIKTLGVWADGQISYEGIVNHRVTLAVDIVQDYYQFLKKPVDTNLLNAMLKRCSSLLNDLANDKKDLKSGTRLSGGERVWSSLCAIGYAIVGLIASSIAIIYALPVAAATGKNILWAPWLLFEQSYEHFKEAATGYQVPLVLKQLEEDISNIHSQFQAAAQKTSKQQGFFATREETSAIAPLIPNTPPFKPK